MCGIFGIWSLNGEPVDLTRLHAATNAIRHRGPDDEGYLLVDTRGGRAASCAGLDTDRRLRLPPLDHFKSDSFDLAFGFRRQRDSTRITGSGFHLSITSNPILSISLSVFAGCRSSTCLPPATNRWSATM